MTDTELIEKLHGYLNEVSELFVLGNMGLLKSEELHKAKHQIEDQLKIYKPYFKKIEALKIEKTIPVFRNTPKIGLFLDASNVVSELTPLQSLLQDLIKAKGGNENVTPVAIPELKITGSTINKAIGDAKTLLETRGAISAVDRIHTVLHGYLKQVCSDIHLSYSEDSTLNQLLDQLKTSHPSLSIRKNNTDQILKSMGNILDKLNPVRNSSSLAHPNHVLLETEEAMLVINTVNTLLAYLNSKFLKK